MSPTSVIDNPKAALQAIRYGDLAIALYAAPGTPLSHRAPLDELADCASKGVAALGGMERVRALHETWTWWNRRLLRRQISEEDYVAAIDLWLESMTASGAPADRERLERCIGLDLGRFLRDSPTYRRTRRHPYADRRPA